MSPSERVEHRRNGFDSSFRTFSESGAHDVAHRGHQLRAHSARVLLPIAQGSGRATWRFKIIFLIFETFLESILNTESIYDSILSHFASFPLVVFASILMLAQSAESGKQISAFQLRISTLNNIETVLKILFHLIIGIPSFKNIIDLEQTPKHE